MPHARHEEVESQLDQVATMRLGELQAFWRHRWGIPPRLRSVRLMRRLIAWRLQEPVFGGLDLLSRRMLTTETIPAWGCVVPGTRLTREHRGELHKVEALDVGFRYQGRAYPNLSRIAQEITGTHWNGPRFFGLRDPDRCHG